MNLIRLLRCALVLWGLLASGWVSGSAVGPTEITDASWVKEPYRRTVTGVPGPDARWQPIALVRQVDNPDGELVRVWFRVVLDSPGTRHGSLALMFPRLLSGGDVYLDGVLVASVAGDTPETQTNWLRPHFVLLPAFADSPGEHVLHVAVSSRQPRVGVAPPVFGPAEAVRATYEHRLLLEYGIVFITIWLTGAGSVLVMAIWVQRRRETLFGLFSLLMLAIGLRSLNFVVPTTSIEAWPWWRALFYLGTGYGIVLLSIIIIRLGEIRWPWLERAALAYAGVGAVAVVLEGTAFLRWETLWLTAFPPLWALTLVVIARVAWMRRTPEIIFLTAVLGAGVLAMIHDYLVKAGLISFSRIYLGHVVSPVVMLALGGIFVQRFVTALRTAEVMNQTLEDRVRAREAELHVHFEESRRAARLQAAAAERQRIMQDMHDGFGSQLITSLILVEQGRADRALLSGVLRQCIDDLRLTIDALTPDDDASETDLLRALSMLRERLDARLQDSRIALAWQLPNGIDAIHVAPRIALAILRIVQEAITNALKHSAAERLAIRIALAGRGLEIAVEDDGRGFPTATPASGCGLSGMKKRARELGARLDIQSSDVGTRVSLALELDEEDRPDRVGR